jgi:hypothetical protein
LREQLSISPLGEILVCCFCIISGVGADENLWHAPKLLFASSLEPLDGNESPSLYWFGLSKSVANGPNLLSTVSAEKSLKNIHSSSTRARDLCF